MVIESRWQRWRLRRMTQLGFSQREGGADVLAFTAGMKRCRRWRQWQATPFSKLGLSWGHARKKKHGRTLSHLAQPKHPWLWQCRTTAEFGLSDQRRWRLWVKTGFFQFTVVNDIGKKSKVYLGRGQNSPSRLFDSLVVIMETVGIRQVTWPEQWKVFWVHWMCVNTCLRWRLFTPQHLPWQQGFHLQHPPCLHGDIHADTMSFTLRHPHRHC